MSSDAEKRKKRLVALPSVENWVRNNRPRFDETFFALSNFDKNPPMFSLAEVKKICARIVTGKLAREDIPQRLEAISHLTVRASARQVIPAFLNYLEKRPIAGLEAFEGFRLPYPIGPKPGGGTLAIPIIPTFVGIRDGKLTPVNKSTKTLTYHDPCYLGRHNQIYAPPRELLGATGIEITEMPRNQERSFCCGGGGGRMWMEEKLGTRINMNRVDESLATGVEEVAVACPFCRVMVSDGVTARESSVEVLDVAQALLRSVKPLI